ncbi:FAD-dependent oxidoreductase [Cohaesibacter gelatinilyticus]|uniref:Short chain enoyl-CoA hydratase /3-hydroxyacyl-CoA dehydrogenase n=1 Tax=Cohaesibacter gelatinilyticus TaxID=372072 RepID=A0A285NDY3_9HYPH|nr:FAD-dependent oxidoreductase [Cohaesibacter gelatinilyticus]SNZ07157.1 short chain enoyl-CoA hydratase /3-hydroxyacyl-CoA dehydrogenase [Cohaesibacter gelatinilyticus]
MDQHNHPNPVSVIKAENGIAVIQIDNPPVNALSHAVRLGLKQAIEQVEVDESIKGAVLHCLGRTFIAGADIKELGKPPKQPYLPDVIAYLDACSKPLVSALHGTALGGGFEVAMGCHYRVALPQARVGLPEVKLGIIPGAGGTQRLPRLIGQEKAADIITSCRQVKMTEALEIGLIDALIDENDLLEGAKSFLIKQFGTGEAPVSISKRPIMETNEESYASLKAKVTKRTRGQISPIKALESIDNAATLSFEEGMAAERAIFLELASSDQAAALRHAFFGERTIAKVPGLENIDPRSVTDVAVIGAGNMGSGIAAAFADAGYSVTVVEMSEAGLEQGKGRVAGIYQGGVKRGKLTQEQAERKIASFSFTTQLADLSRSDLVIEAVFEDMQVKKDLFTNLQSVVGPDCILATNTSYLDINEIASVLEKPENVVGLHFFSPANIMKLLEIVDAEKTAPEVLATALAVGKKLRKIAVIAGVCDGFIGNRIWARNRQLLEFFLEDGAEVEDIDKAMLEFGFPMGPYSVFDLSGLDIAWAQRKRKKTSMKPAERYVEIPDLLCEQGRLGIKAGKGWYDYEDGSRKPQPSSEVAKLVASERVRKGISQRKLSSEEIQKRVLAGMINEGCKILQEKIALRPVDIDMVLLNGYGYPVWRGGPMFAADQLGLADIVRTLKEMEAEYGEGWEVSPVLAACIERGMKLAEWQCTE